MNKFYTSCIAAVLAAATFSVSAADMTAQEQSELRARAERLQAEKQRNPSWDGGRMTSDMHKTTKAPTTKAPAAKKTKSKAKKNKSSVKKTSNKSHGKSQRAQ